jgi:hypothetical protein
VDVSFPRVYLLLPVLRYYDLKFMRSSMRTRIVYVPVDCGNDDSDVNDTVVDKIKEEHRSVTGCT